VAGVGPVPAQMWKGFSARSWCRRRRGELACERAGTAADALTQFESATVAPPLLAHVRSRDWLPVPQVTEHAPHGPAAYLLGTVGSREYSEYPREYSEYPHGPAAYLLGTVGVRE
jgi:hypothetical protein